MTSYRITLLPGDGIGPEITAVTRQLLDAVSRRHGFALVYDEQPMGGAAIDATGEPLPASTLEACRSSDAVLLAAIGSPNTTPCPATGGRRQGCWPCGPAWACSPTCAPSRSCRP